MAAVAARGRRARRPGHARGCSSRPPRTTSSTRASSATGESGGKPKRVSSGCSGYARDVSQTVELPRVHGPGSGLGGAWRVIVRNDDHNTFDHVAHVLARYIPGVTVRQGYALADRIHGTGLRSCGAGSASRRSSTGSSSATRGSRWRPSKRTSGRQAESAFSAWRSGRTRLTFQTRSEALERADQPAAPGRRALPPAQPVERRGGERVVVVVPGLAERRAAPARRRCATRRRCRSAGGRRSGRRELMLPRHVVQQEHRAPGRPTAAPVSAPVTPPLKTKPSAKGMARPTRPPEEEHLSMTAGRLLHQVGRVALGLGPADVCGTASRRARGRARAPRRRRRPPRPTCGRVRVALLVGEGVVLAVVGHPA